MRGCGTESDVRWNHWMNCWKILKSLVHPNIPQRIAWGFAQIENLRRGRSWKLREPQWTQHNVTQTAPSRPYSVLASDSGHKPTALIFLPKSLQSLVVDKFIPYLCTLWQSHLGIPCDPINSDEDFDSTGTDVLEPLEMLGNTQRVPLYLWWPSADSWQWCEEISVSNGSISFGSKLGTWIIGWIMQTIIPKISGPCPWVLHLTQGQWSL